MRRRASLALLTVALLSGCGPEAGADPATGSPASMSATSAVAATTAATDAPGDPAPRPTEVPGPPVATLSMAGAEPAAGELGTFAWGDLGSDAPWIVPPPARAVAGRERLEVAFDPPMDVERWTAAWAEVTAEGVGPPIAGSRGTGPPIGERAPGRPGTWSLQVQSWFGQGRQATWYWRVEVHP